uniref:Uncharacterized protein n=1 Tax=Coptotermes formosanus TaxID=36987 RepID=R4UM77_COPFO|nr:hypothetical protein [Coptotermes formosanus]
MGKTVQESSNGDILYTGVPDLLTMKAVSFLLVALVALTAQSHQSCVSAAVFATHALHPLYAFVKGTGSLLKLPRKKWRH